MTCKHCEMKPRWSGKLVWTQGEPFTHEDYGPNVKSYIELDSSYGYLLFTEDFYEFDEEQHITSIPIYNCPWCGEKLGDGE